MTNLMPACGYSVATRRALVRALAITTLLVVSLFQVGCGGRTADQQERLDRLENRMDHELGRLQPRLDLDWDVVVPVDESDIPALEGGEDCNDNGIDDLYDFAQYIPRGPYDVGNEPWELAAGDLDGDNLLDLVVSNHADGTVTILWQRAHRNFEPGPRLNVEALPSCVVVEDFDADGDLDIAVGHMPETDPLGYISMLWNDGDASWPDFRSVQGLVLGGELEPRKAPRCIIAADIAADDARAEGSARSDLVATSGADTAAKVTLLVNPGNGTFEPTRHNRLGRNEEFARLTGNPYGLVATDWDNDSDMDLVVAGGESESNIAFLRNLRIEEPEAGSEFSDWLMKPLNTGSAPKAIASGDLVGDDNGFDDLAVVNAGSGDVAVIINTGHLGGQWAIHSLEPVPYLVGEGAQDIAIADLDDDGALDIAVPVPDEDKVVILANNGSGRFADSRDRPHKIELPVRGGPRGILAADLDRDGRIELAVANRDTGKVWVLHRRATAAAMPYYCRYGTVTRRPNE